MNDLERKLSDALHTLTPEPPTAYRFSPPADEVAESVADVIDLDGVIDLDVARRRRRPKLGLLLAAAAVVVLGGGIAAAAVAFDRTDTQPAGPQRSSAPTSAAPVCGNGSIMVGLGEPIIAVQAKTVTASVLISNTGSRLCRLPVAPIVTLTGGKQPVESDRSAFPPVPKVDLELHPGGELVYTARMRSTGTCAYYATPTVTGPGLTVDRSDGFLSTLSLSLHHCTLSPRSLSVVNVG